MNLKEWRILGHYTLKVLRDSNETVGVHVAEELTGRQRFTDVLASFGGSEAGQELLRERPELNSEQVDYAWLSQLPAGTLGRAYADHLSGHGLSADAQAVPTRYIDDPDMAYLMRRFRQTHDVWHPLIDLGVQGYEETLIHAFSWGQLRLPVSAMVIAGGAIKHMLLEGRWGALRHGLLEAYRNGRDAKPLLAIHWEQLWEVPLDEVRRRYNVRPCTRD